MEGLSHSNANTDPDQHTPNTTKLTNLYQTKQTILNEGDESVINIVLLDWDNTLMPTSYLLSNIDYELDETSNKFNEFIMYQEQETLMKNLEKVGQSTFDLLTEMLIHLKSSDIKIITNGEKGWLYESLFIAGIFCKIYTKIRMLLNEYHIEVLYARDYDCNPLYWKKSCFDHVLASYLKKNEVIINVTTIGDQWHDHDSVRNINADICHNEIKLFGNPNCRYLSVELKYIAFLIQNGELFKCKDGLSLEFDGYNE